MGQQGRGGRSLSRCRLLLCCVDAQWLFGLGVQCPAHAFGTSPDLQEGATGLFWR